MISLKLVALTSKNGVFWALVGWILAKYLHILTLRGWGSEIAGMRIKV